jgi:hypothetical protein
MRNRKIGWCPEKFSCFKKLLDFEKLSVNGKSFYCDKRMEFDENQHSMAKKN